MSLTASCLTPPEVWTDPAETRTDPYYKAKMVRCYCNACQQCWLYVDGPRQGSCFHMGPFYGYYLENPDDVVHV